VPEIREHSSSPDSRQFSYLFIVTTLNPMHFNNGQLIIQCTAHVSTLYRETTEVHLMSRTREPIPERGRLTKLVNKCIPSANNTAGNILSLKHFIIQQMHKYVIRRYSKIITKYLKIFKIAPTYFGSQGIHHQRSLYSAWLKLQLCFNRVR